MSNFTKRILHEIKATHFSFVFSERLSVWIMGTTHWDGKQPEIMKLFNSGILQKLVSHMQVNIKPLNTVTISLSSHATLKPSFLFELTGSKMFYSI